MSDALKRLLAEQREMQNVVATGASFSPQKIEPAKPSGQAVQPSTTTSKNHNARASLPEPHGSPSLGSSRGKLPETKNPDASPPLSGNSQFQDRQYYPNTTSGTEGSGGPQTPDAPETLLLDWVGHYRYPQGSNSQNVPVGGRGHKIGLHHREGRALQRLCRSYPFVVYLYFSLWRKMLTMVSRQSRAPSLLHTAPDGAWIPGNRAPMATQEREWEHKGIRGSMKHLEHRGCSPHTSVPISVDFGAALLLNGQVDCVNLLLKNIPHKFPIPLRGNKTSSYWSGKRPPLHLAIQSRSFTLVKYLLVLGVPMDGEDHNFDLPVHTAARAGTSEILKLLLDHGAELSPSRTDYCTPLCRAAQGGNADVLNMLLPLSPKEHNGVFEHSKVSLIEAARCDSVSSLKCLLRNGADVNERYHATTALHVATHSETVKLLLASGAKVDTSSSGDHAAMASEEHHHSVTPLHTAVEYDQEEKVKLLLEAGANVNFPRGDRATPLIIAVTRSKPNLSTVRLLLQHGADPELKCLLFWEDKKECTALDVAKDPEAKALLRASMKGLH